MQSNKTSSDCEIFWITFVSPLAKSNVSQTILSKIEAIDGKMP